MRTRTNDTTRRPPRAGRRLLSFLSGALGGLLAGAALLAPTLGLADSLDYISQQGPESYYGLPVTITETSAPLVMLTLSRDHQLHYKAYNDYTDLDGDGLPETTYKHSIDYYGYFDSNKCYSYNTGNNRFEPQTITQDKYCSGQWSGNFLNWATMTRMDAVRKLLYGGLRSSDTSSLTVLERSYLPTDGHAFAKYYNGSDIRQLTPFSVPATSPTMAHTFPGEGLQVSADSITGQDIYIDNWTYGGASKYVIWIPISGIDVQVGDQIKITPSSGASPAIYGGVQYIDGWAEVHVYPGSWTGTGTILNATLTNLSRTGISFCNLTRGDGTDNYVSQTNTNSPRLRVAKGNYELWGANEQRQCQWSGGYDSLTGYAENQQSNFNAGFRSNGNRALFSGLNASAENPSQSNRGLGTGVTTGEYVVRVEACVIGKEGAERCKAYPDAEANPTTVVQKPIGLLQVYGDDNRIKFGLVTPTYQKNVSGGVLRKKLPDPESTTGLSDEINISTNGTFKSFTGIIGNLNKLKIYGYRYDQGDNYGQGDGCTYQLTGIYKTGGSGTSLEVAEGNCSSWGNPIGEAYIETLRYLAGADSGPDPAFTYSGSTRDATLGLSVVTNWNDPIDETNFCSSLNVIAFNASVSTYDTDSVGGLANLAGSPSATTFTNAVGAAEGLSGNYFYGEGGSDTSGLCIAKSLTSLAGIRGICPEAATQDGGWLMAGAAYAAKTQPIRDDIDTGDNSDSVMTVDTYGIALATNVPRIQVRDPANSSVVLAEILPVYRLDFGSQGYGGGAIVDFRIVKEDVAAGTGSYYINWEDSSQGGDYDQDLWGTITYQLSSDKTTLSITTDGISASTNNPQGFGYIVAGSTQDGAHFHSGIYDFDYTDPTNVTVKTGGSSGTNANGTTFSTGGGINSSGGCVDCKLGDPATTVNYTLGGSGVGTLKDPLFYAAKYGGFNDLDDDDVPDQTSEWDSREADGSSGSDGLPDNYFYVSNPNALEDSLQQAFSAILARVASGTAAAVVANAREGQGAIYQALYEPVRPDTDSEAEVGWIGTLHALWVDSQGYLREDDGDAVLEGFGADPAVALYFDETESITRVRRYTGDPEDGVSEPASIESLRTLWNAREQLSAIGDVLTQRDYDDASIPGRYIFTWMDYDLDGEVDNNEQQPFVESTFGAGSYGMLNAENSTDAATIVRYVRGQDQTDLRSRTLNYDGDVAGTAEIMRLGDIVNSTPTVVGTPQEAFDLLYQDSTYATFRDHYRQRRQVIYVGANDGMLHAFNGGFFNAEEDAFKLSANGEAKHPLGSELWAYVPFNLLPHLTWMTSTDYAHAWYVDGKPRVFDARVFADDADHPGGWGTVLVVGFRQGGGELDLVVDNGASDNRAGFSNFALEEEATTLTTRPVFAMFDITNPEAEPRLLAELSDPKPDSPTLGYTTSYPTAIAIRDAGISDKTEVTDDRWYLVFGNGPDTLGESVSHRPGGLYLYDLEAKEYVSGYAPLSLVSAADDSFIGDPVAVDWDLNFKADGLYFGSAGGTADAPTGKLFRIAIDEKLDAAAWPAPTVLLDPGNPVLTTPSVTFDDAGNHWVYAGTGRFLSEDDKTSRDPQAVFGVIDDDSGKTANYSSLVDVTKAQVTYGGTVSGVTGAADMAELSKLTTDAGGWRLSFDVPDAAARNVSQTSLFNEILFVTAFTPSESLCTGEGTSDLFGLYYKTGTPRATTPVFGCGTDEDAEITSCGSGSDTVRRIVDLGAGLAASPTLQANGDVRDSTGLTVFTQTSTGAIGQTQGTLTDAARSAEIDWREMRE